MADHTIYEAKGCEKCRHTGYLGRLGIFENLLVTDAIRPLIVTRQSANVIKQKALEQGMRTLRSDGWRKVREGITTIDEVLRVSEEDEE